jgi:UDP-glucose 4-epimerase
MQTAFSSAKDYISVDEVCELLVRIALEGREQIYNVASGISTSHGEISEVIARMTGATFEVVANAPELRDEPIDTSRISKEFGFTSGALVDQLEEVVAAFRKVTVAI